MQMPWTIGRRRRSLLYTDQTISTFLMLKGIFSLSLRATQGLLDSLFELMNVPLCAPRLQRCQQAGPYGEGGLSAAIERNDYRPGYRLNWPEGVWRRRVEGQETRRRKAVNLAKVASGG